MLNDERCIVHFKGNLVRIVDNDRLIYTLCVNVILVQNVATIVRDLLVDEFFARICLSCDTLKVADPWCFAIRQHIGGIVLS